MADPPRFEHGFPAPEARVISRLHYGSCILPGTPTIEPVAQLKGVALAISASGVRTGCHPLRRERSGYRRAISGSRSWLPIHRYYLADPPRFEHGLQAPQAHVISRLHYGSSDFCTVGSGLIPTVGITSRGGGASSNSVVRVSSTLVPS